MSTSARSKSSGRLSNIALNISFTVEDTNDLNGRLVIVDGIKGNEIIDRHLSHSDTAPGFPGDLFIASREMSKTTYLLANPVYLSSRYRRFPQLSSNLLKDFYYILQSLI